MHRLPDYLHGGGYISGMCVTEVNYITTGEPVK